jgi:hypothetical protein
MDFKIADHETLDRRIKNTIFDRWLRLCYSIHRDEQLQSSGVAPQTADGESQQSDGNSHDRAYYAKEERPAVNNVNDRGNKVAVTHEATTFSGSLYPRVQEHQPQSSAPSVALTTAGGSNARIPRLKSTKTACDGEVLDFFCPMCRLPQQLKSGIREHEQYRAWKYDAWWTHATRSRILLTTSQKACNTGPGALYMSFRCLRHAREHIPNTGRMASAQYRVPHEAEAVMSRLFRSFHGQRLSSNPLTGTPPHRIDKRSNRSHC